MSPTSTSSSSAEIIPLEASQPTESKPNGKPTFQQAREEWLRRWQAEGHLTHADRTLVTQIYLHFNRARFDRTGELLAWPGWETMATRADLSTASIFRGLRKLERLSALKIIHRGRDSRTGWNLPNEYLATSPPFNLKGGHLSSCNVATFQDESRLLEELLDSLNKEDSLKVERLRPSAAKKKSRKQKNNSKPAEDSLPANSASTSPQATAASSAPPPQVPRGPPSPKPDRWRQERAHDEAVLERYAAAAQDGFAARKGT